MKKKDNTPLSILPSKHGVHVQPGTKRTIQAEKKIESTDPEDPLTDDLDPDQLPWETDEERILRDESEDPDAPPSF